MTPPASPTDSSLPSAGPGGEGPLGILQAGPPPARAGSKWKGDFEGTRLTSAGSPLVGCAPVSSAATSETAFDANGIPAWLVSTIVHALLLIILVLLNFDDGSSSSDSLLVSLSREREVVELEQLPEEVTASVMATADPDPQVSSKLTAVPAGGAVAFSSLVPPSRWEPDSSLLELTTAGTRQQPLQLPQGGLYARTAESRAALGRKYGATPESEEAVEAALRWLALHQQRDGSWSFDLKQEPCNGRCRHTASPGNTARPATAATGLALLAFLGAGYTHHEGKYADEIRRGLYFLREQGNPTNSGLDLQHGSMYGHGIATMAISEAMAMTNYLGKQDSDLFALTDAGASFTMTAQHHLGGWRYVPGSPGDITVSGWAVLSLISAQHGGVVLRTTTLSRAERFVRSLAVGQGYQFKYEPSEQKALKTPTAVGLCLLLYLGQSPQPTPFAMALDQLVADGPEANNVYFNYYASLALHHARHRDWDAWHQPLRDHLVRTQATEGHEAGSWHFKDTHGDVGGRLYTTAMAAMILEVYYRYLPLYRSDDEFRLD